MLHFPKKVILKVGTKKENGHRPKDVYSLDDFTLSIFLVFEKENKKKGDLIQ